MLNSTDADVPPLRLGIVPYLNVQPMVYGLRERCPQLSLVFAPPSELEPMLRRDEIDLGIVPIVAAFMAEGRAIYDMPVIASNGAVYSVLIAARSEIGQLKRIWRDPHSLTSNALTEVLLRDYWQVGAKLLPPSGARSLQSQEGKVIIGDPAIRAHDRWPSVYDLGEAWKDWTGLPFVFAAWVGRQGQDIGALGALLRDLVSQNMRQLEKVVAAHGAPSDTSPELLVQYLRENLTFEFGEAEKTAITKFHAACIKHKLVEDRPLLWDKSRP